ncbi:hypothetical protein PanNE5_04500 [Pandoraea sp. NE5]|nr:hypothetical protein PanNE5_04500 [Pandoraea sp. NE5]
MRSGVELAEQHEAAGKDQMRKHGIGDVRMRKQHSGGGVERSRRPAKVTHGERDFGVGDYTSSACQGLMRAEATRRPLEQLSRAGKLAQLCHRDAAQRECWRIVAQRDPTQGTQRIAGSERARGSSNEGVHRAILPGITHGAPECNATQNTITVGLRDVF